MNNNLLPWAQLQLQRLLPLEEQSIREVLDYTASLSKEAGAEHLKNLLGDSPQALEFISSFNARRQEGTHELSGPAKEAALRQSHADGNGNSPGGQVPKRNRKNRVKPPLHDPGPIRQPEDHGNIGTGYTKSSTPQDYYIPRSNPPSQPRASNSTTHLTPAPSLLSQQPEAVQTPVPDTHHSPSTSNSPQRVPSRSSRLPPFAAGSLISDLPNVKSKKAKKTWQDSNSARTQKSTRTSNIDDLTSAIAALELSTNPTLSSERRKCDCNASIHPLFETAPNCLSCGKIICALEGLQPCSFCDSAVVSKEQVQAMVRALKDERGQERMALHNNTALATSSPRSGGGSPMLGSGTATPDGDSSGDESSSAAARARAHRDKLLGFQMENARRTRIHDEAADYDMTLSAGATQWMSPVQRAAALKKQQKYLRELEESKQPEWEKKRTVMSMSIKNGKLVRTYETVSNKGESAAAAAGGGGGEGGTEQDDYADYTDEGRNGNEDGLSRNFEPPRSGSGHKLSHNPLLSDRGLMRPVWKAPEMEANGDAKDKEKEKSRAGRGRSTWWRRVQDDQEDNEQWILDGGLRGFATDWTQAG